MKRGFTLLETALMASLLSAVLLVLVQSLVPCLRIWVLTQTVSEARTKGVLTYQKIFTELRASCAGSIRVHNSPSLQACSFLAVGQEGGYNPVNGLPIWRQILVYYVRQGSLFRKTWVPGDFPLLPHSLPANSAFALSDTELQSVCVSPDGNPKRICTNVSSFSLELISQNLWKLTLDVEAYSQRGKVTCRSQSHLTLRNGS